MPEVLGFDIYGTLVDPLDMDEHLGEMVGEGAERFSALWREKQIEYTWRRGLMREYADFGVCTRQALDFAALSFGLELTDTQRERLVEEYQNLRPFPDVLPGLGRLRSGGHTLVAFSNGVERTARVLLERGACSITSRPSSAWTTSAPSSPTQRSTAPSRGGWIGR